MAGAAVHPSAVGRSPSRGRGRGRAHFLRSLSRPAKQRRDALNAAAAAAALTLLSADASNAVARTVASQPFASLARVALQGTIDALDVPTDCRSVAVRGYARVKGLVVHGYFTSERV